MPLFVLGSAVHCDCLMYSQPPTYQVIQAVTGLFTPSYLIFMCISARQNTLANQICMLYRLKSYPIVGELAGFSIEGTVTLNKMKKLS